MDQPTCVPPPVSVEDTISELVAKATRSGLHQVKDSLEERIRLGLELDAKNKDGDTILHVLTAATDKNPKDETYLMVFDAIVDSSVMWWCKKNKLDYPKNTKANKYIRYKYMAIQYLSIEVYDKREFNVMELAFKLANVLVVERLILMENVKCFRVDGKMRYDAFQLTPLTNQTVSHCCTNKVSPRPSLVEWLLGKNSLEKIVDVLDLEPVRKIENHYMMYTVISYITLMIVHTIYMVVFSYCGVVLMEHRRNSSLVDVSSTRVLFNCVVPIEPACILIYGFYMLMRLVLCRGEVSVMIKLRSIGFQYFVLFFLLLYVFVVAALLYQYNTIGENQNNLLSAALLYGWLMTLPLTRGISQVSYLMKVLQSIFLKDVYKILIIYTFVLMGFSIALHVQFQVSSDIIAVYVNPFYTMYNMFNIMLGMGELFPENTESSLQAAGGSPLYCRLMYIVYVVTATIILLNLLIAMMNTSYSVILQQQTLQWRIESVQLGIELERNFMFLTRCFPPSHLHYGLLNPLTTPTIGPGWYIEVDEQKSSRSAKVHDLHAKMDLVTERLELLENRMIAELRRIEYMFDDMKKERHIADM